MINQISIIRKYNNWFLSTNKYKIMYKSNKNELKDGNLREPQIKYINMNNC